MKILTLAIFAASLWAQGPAIGNGSSSDGGGGGSGTPAVKVTHTFASAGTFSYAHNLNFAYPATTCNVLSPGAASDFGGVDLSGVNSAVVTATVATTIECTFTSGGGGGGAGTIIIESNGTTVTGSPATTLNIVPGTGVINTITAPGGIAALQSSADIGYLSTQLGINAVNAQTGTSYTVLASDKSKLITFANSGSVAVTLPQGIGGFAAPFSFQVVNYGSGTVTITPSTSTINHGAATLVLTTGQGAGILTDPSGNYQALLGGSGGGSGGSVFTGSTGSTIASSSTPVFSLADVSVKSPIRFQISPVVNVTGPTITNLTAGATFSIAVTTDGTHTWNWNSIISDNVCPIYTAAAATTTATIQVDQNGTTLHGLSCFGSINGLIFFGATVPASSTSPGPSNMDCRTTSHGVDCYDGTNHWVQIEPVTLASHNFATAVSASGILSGTQPAFTDISGTATNAQIPTVNTPTPGATCSTSGNSTTCICTTTCTVTVQVPAAGVQICAFNDDNVSTVITLSAIGSSARYENTARTAYGTAGTGTFISGGAVADGVCLYGRDTTHYLTPYSHGTWTAN